MIPFFTASQRQGEQAQVNPFSDSRFVKHSALNALRAKRQAKWQLKCLGVFALHRSANDYRFRSQSSRNARQALMPLGQ